MDIAEKILQGKADLDAAYEAGKRAEKIEFINKYLDYGNRKSFVYAFAHVWDNEMAKLPYRISPTNAEGMFNYSKISGDLTEIMNVDFSKTTKANYCFCHGTALTKLGIIDFRKVTQLSWCFYDMPGLKEIVEFYPPNVGLEFTTCGALEKIKVMSPITQNFDIACAKVLNAESIASIAESLSDDVTGKTLKLSLVAVNIAFETSAGANDGSTSAEWQALIGTKPNWTIALA